MGRSTLVHGVDVMMNALPQELRTGFEPTIMAARGDGADT